MCVMPLTDRHMETVLAVIVHVYDQMQHINETDEGGGCERKDVRITV